MGLMRQIGGLKWRHQKREVELPAGLGSVGSKQNERIILRKSVQESRVSNCW